MTRCARLLRTRSVADILAKITASLIEKYYFKEEHSMKYLRLAAAVVIVIGGAVCTTIISGKCGEIVGEKLGEWVDWD